MALALVIPLSAGVFDISVTYTMTLSGVLCTYAMVNSGQPLIVGFLIAMGASVLVGVMNGVVVVVGKIDSLIGTLATGFLDPGPGQVAHGQSQRQRRRAERLVHQHRSEVRSGD